MCDSASRNSVDEEWHILDTLWERVLPLLPPERPHPKGGRRYNPARQCMDGIYYYVRTGCQWKALPRCFGAARPVHLQFQQWRAAGVFERQWQQRFPLAVFVDGANRHGMKLVRRSLGALMIQRPGPTADQPQNISFCCWNLLYIKSGDGSVRARSNEYLIFMYLQA